MKIRIFLITIVFQSLALAQNSIPLVASQGPKWQPPMTPLQARREAATTQAIQQQNLLMQQKMQQEAQSFKIEQEQRQAILEEIQHANQQHIQEIAQVNVQNNESQSHFADFANDGNTFLASCDPDSKTTGAFEKSMCASYVNGVSDGFELAQAAPRFQREFCRPLTATHGQIYELSFKFIKEHPEIRHWTTRNLIVTSLSQAFPCPATEPKKTVSKAKQ